MRKDGSDADAAVVDCGGVPLPGPDQDIDLEKQEHTSGLPVDDANCASLEDSINEHDLGLITIVISDGESRTTQELVGKPLNIVESDNDQLPCVASRAVQEKEEVLIDLGRKCRGGLAKAHRSCIDTWFCKRGSNKCEICQNVTVNVPHPDPQQVSNYWVRGIDTNFRSPNREQGCCSPCWVALSMLVRRLLLDFFRYSLSVCSACKYYSWGHCGTWTCNSTSTDPGILPLMENEENRRNRYESWVSSWFVSTVCELRRRAVSPKGRC